MDLKGSQSGLFRLLSHDSILRLYQSEEVFAHPGILERIQRLDPVGCGARDTKEALLIQARAVPGGQYP